MSKRRKCSSPGGRALRAVLYVGKARVSNPFSKDGLFERLIVTIQGTSRARKDFAAYCASLGVQSSPVQFLDGEKEALRAYDAHCKQLRKIGKDAPEYVYSDWARPYVFDCVGFLESLRAVSEHWAVVRFELAIDASIGRAAAGSGEVTDKSRQARRFALSPKAEKQRIEAIEAGAPVDLDSVGDLSYKPIAPTEKDNPLVWDYPNLEECEQLTAHAIDAYRINHAIGKEAHGIDIIGLIDTGTAVFVLRAFDNPSDAIAKDVRPPIERQW